MGNRQRYSGKRWAIYWSRKPGLGRFFKRLMAKVLRQGAKAELRGDRPRRQNRHIRKDDVA